jgi:transcriptional regulator GlxA family with amidase domain
VIDNDRFAAAGGIGALDMMLDLMEADYGRKLAAEVAEWFGHSRIRPAADRGLLSLRLRTGVDDERVLQAVRLMEKQADDKVSVADVARTLKISVDTLERDFERITEQSPVLSAHAHAQACKRLNNAHDYENLRDRCRLRVPQCGKLLACISQSLRTLSARVSPR